MSSTDTIKPRLVIMVGIPGSGKSFFAEHFSETFKAPLISHHKIQQLIGDNNSDVTKRITSHMLDEAMKTGKIIIYEGYTDKRNDRMDLIKKAYLLGYDTIFVWVQTEINDAKKRSIKNNLSDQLFETRLKSFNAPHSSEKYIVISGKHTYNTQLKTVLKSIITPIPTQKPIPANRATKPNRSLIR